MKLCLESADETKLRSVSPGALYRLLVLGRVFSQTLDPALHARALDLVPAELRARLK